MTCVWSAENEAHSRAAARTCSIPGKGVGEENTPSSSEFIRLENVVSTVNVEWATRNMNSSVEWRAWFRLKSVVSSAFSPASSRLER